MKWRLEEGEGEAIYEIGVEDNGLLVGLTDQELTASLNTLNTMASRSGKKQLSLLYVVIIVEHTPPTYLHL